MEKTLWRLRKHNQPGNYGRDSLPAITVKQQAIRLQKKGFGVFQVGLILWKDKISERHETIKRVLVSFNFPIRRISTHEPPYDHLQKDQSRVLMILMILVLLMFPYFDTYEY